ncbi:ROK family transcriptional regulator [Devosia rhodophyticola]|uniref:ROK family transcriptional regulator n=1 Tax=Devosia rhodophyticola TaxID=3026423 RepID=A0ABY7Z155_9HYPH|nr:ROK family transcriptional regulator [Devosia rhodophyticola]WDR07217.1 ROK family transcriptional regulator [Devosia rhodophyticola]
MSKVPKPVHDVFEAGGRGLQHHDLRRANERAIMSVVAFNAGASNAEISRLSGLAPQTVSAILVELEKAYLIKRGELLRGRRGQPATPIYIDPDGAFGVGCEISWRHMQVYVIDLWGRTRGQARKEYAYPDASTIVEDINTMVEGLLGDLSLIHQFRVHDLGIAMPTQLWRYIHLVGAPKKQSALWEKKDLAGELAAATSLEVSVFNDGNAACWAELIAFSKPRPGDFIYLMVSRYIGAGIVGQGQLWEGPTGNSANLGSMLVSQKDTAPVAAQYIASISALEARLVAAGHGPMAGLPDEWEWGSMEPILSEWLEVVSKALAEIIFNTTMVLECKLAVVDGFMPPEVVKRLTQAVTDELAKLPEGPYVTPRVVQGHLGSSAPVLGAAELPLYRRYFSRSLDDLTG